MQMDDEAALIPRYRIRENDESQHIIMRIKCCDKIMNNN